jgi:hypothetical protein
MLLSACAGTPTVFHKVNATEAEFQRDLYECQHMGKMYATQFYSPSNTNSMSSTLGSAIGAGIGMGITARQEAINCMNSRGYSIVKQDTKQPE